MRISIFHICGALVVIACIVSGCVHKKFRVACVPDNVISHEGKQYYECEVL
jgi:hypothetical protein